MKDLDGAKRYGGSAELKDAMKNGGVQGPPEITFLEQADEVAY